MTSSSRGISVREAGRMLDHPIIDDTNGPVISLDNVTDFTTFQLRQALKARGYFGDDYVGPVNYQILLQKMIEVLHDDRQRRDAKRTELLETQQQNAGGEGVSIAEKHAREKALRKAAAIERSKQRINDGTYFESKRASNQRAIADVEIATKPQTEDSMEIDQRVEDVTTQQRDPLALRFRSKIGGRYV